METKYTFEQIIDELNKIKPCDLVSGTTDNQTVISFCIQVANAISKIGEIQFTKESANVLAEKLCKLGCGIFPEDAHPNYTTGEELSINEQSKLADRINLPLNIFANVSSGNLMAISYIKELIRGNLLNTWINVATSYISQNEAEDLTSPVQ